MKKVMSFLFILSNLIGETNFYQIQVDEFNFSNFPKIFLLPKKELIEEKYYNTVDYQGFISHNIIECLYNKNIKLKYPLDFDFPGHTGGASSFLAFMLCAKFLNDKILSKSNINIFATGAYGTETVKYFYLKLFFYSNIFDYEYEKVKEITQHNRENFITLDNIKFAKIGMLEKKIANIFLFVKNNQLKNNAIFLSEEQRKEVSSIINKIKIITKETNDENLLKCIDILNKINYISNTEELQKLTKGNIKTFNDNDCPTINTKIAQNEYTSLLKFLAQPQTIENFETITINELENKSNPFL